MWAGEYSNRKGIGGALAQAPTAKAMAVAVVSATKRVQRFMVGEFRLLSTGKNSITRHFPILEQVPALAKTQRPPPTGGRG